jgi:hypothetical protein
MGAHTIWLGPVSGFDVRAAVLDGSHLHVVQVHDKASAADVLAKWADADGRYLPGMCRQLGIDLGEVPDLFVASFSAGHNLAKVLTKHPDDRAAIRALLLADSAQAAWGDARHHTVSIPTGYLDHATRCAQTAEQILVATCSSFTDGSYAPSSATMDELALALAHDTGLALDTAPGLVPSSLEPEPCSRLGVGSFASLDYGTTISHEDHVHKLAPEIFRRVIGPWWESWRPTDIPPGA